MISNLKVLALLLEELAKIRPLYHSEADFQHALAWLLHSLQPKARVRLEYRPYADENLACDIWIHHPAGCLFGPTGEVRYPAGQLALELKYPTSKLEGKLYGEQYALRNHGAQLQIRYDIVKDITRLERMVDSVPGTVGVALLLTNDSAYWNPPRNQEVGDIAFRLTEGYVLEGTRVWRPHLKDTTISGRESPLKLRGRYTCEWKEYRKLRHTAGSFRYLPFLVIPDSNTANVAAQVAKEDGNIDA